MPAPAGLPHFPALFSATAALALLSPLEAFADEIRDNLRQAITRDLPRYDPAAYEKAQADKAARAVPKNTPGPLPETKALAVAPPTSAPASEHTLVLPKVTVRSNERPIKRLPRIDPPAQPLKDLQPEPFESAAGRDARLVRKHFTKLEQILIPLLGGSLVGQAREAESRQQKAAQMNDLATSLEIQEAAGRDPEEIRKLRAEYTKLYYSGPK